MAAFLLAVELLADGIELDVQLTRDGHPIVLHDPQLHYDGEDFHLHAKTDDSTRPIFVGDIDFADIAAAPVVFPDGSRVPLERFEAVLDVLPAWTWLDVELKAGWTYDPRLAAVVARCLAARPERCLVSSFDHVVLAELHALSPQVPLRGAVRRTPGRPACGPLAHPGAPLEPAAGFHHQRRRRLAAR